MDIKTLFTLGINNNTVYVCSSSITLVVWPWVSYLTFTGLSFLEIRN